MCILRSILCLFICCSFLPFYSRAQIVNIEKSRMQSDTTGWMGSAGAALSLTKNTQQVFSSDLDTHLQYKSAKSLYLILGSYGFLKGANNRLIDHAFLHFRYNYKMSKVVRWELFTQLQKNTITLIKSRFLLGTGPRFKIFSNKTLRLYAGTLIMYEQEQETGSLPILHKDVRNSNYFSFSFTPNKMLEIISTSFYQPLLKQWNDCRFLTQISVKAKAGKQLAVKINWNYLNDPFPAKGIPSVNYSLSTGVEYDF